jgi:predicted PurR-regulated permease PerM
MKTAKTTLIASSVITLFLLVLYFVYLAKIVIVYLLIALLLAIAIMPLVRLFERRRVGRITATILSMILILVGFGVVVAAIVTPLAFEGVQLVRNLPTITNDVLANPFVSSIITNLQLKNEIAQLSNNTSEIIFGSSTKILVITRGFLSFFSSFAIIIVLTFLLIVDGESLWAWFLGFFSPARQVQAESIAKRISKAVSGFISGNLLISGIAGLVTIILLYLLKVPYVFALAALVALFDLIPLVGAAIATIAVGFVALIQGPVIALIAVAVLILYQFIEGHLIQPLVYSKSIDLSALFIIIASIVGAEVAGIGGVILAIPLGAVLSIIGGEAYQVLVKSKNHAPSH